LITENGGWWNPIRKQKKVEDLFKTSS